jgi:hypothetical protein
MITRRTLVVAASSSLGIALAAKGVKAQSEQIPTSEEVIQTVKDHIKYEKVLDNLSLVVLALVLGLWDQKGPPSDNDRARYRQIVGLFFNPDFYNQLKSMVSVPGAAQSIAQIIRDAGAKAQPVVQRIEGFLKEQGVAGRTNRDGVRSVYLFIQMKAVADTKVEPWYCDVYPFSYFCRSG